MVCLEKTGTGIKLSGHITFLNLSKVKEQGKHLLNAFSHCEINCAELSTINSSGLALLLSWLRYAKQKKKTLIFLKIPTIIKSMAALYCLEHIIN